MMPSFRPISVTAPGDILLVHEGLHPLADGGEFLRVHILSRDESETSGEPKGGQHQESDDRMAHGGNS